MNCDRMSDYQGGTVLCTCVFVYFLNVYKNKPDIAKKLCLKSIHDINHGHVHNLTSIHFTLHSNHKSQQQLPQATFYCKVKTLQ